MARWRRDLPVRGNLDRLLLRAGRWASQGSRDRIEAIPDIRLRAEHVEGARLLLDREALVELLPKGAVGAELGVDSGDFSQVLLDRAEPRVLHLVDSWGSRRYGEAKRQAVVERFAGELDRGRVQIHRDWSTRALQVFEDGSLDWAYLDTDHTYATTREELALLDRKVSPTGVIAGHDYVTGNWRAGRRYGVVEAVNELCLDRGWRFLAVTHETDRHLSFALERIRHGAPPG